MPTNNQPQILNALSNNTLQILELSQFASTIKKTAYIGQTYIFMPNDHLAAVIDNSHSYNSSTNPTQRVSYNTIAIMSTAPFHLLKVLNGHTDAIRVLDIFPDGRLASGSNDGTVRIWDTQRGECLKVLSVGASVWISRLAILSNEHLISGYLNYYVWDTLKGNLLKTISSDICDTPVPYSIDHFVDLGQQQIKLYNALTGTLVKKMDMSDNYPHRWVYLSHKKAGYSTRSHQNYSIYLFDLPSFTMNIFQGNTAEVLSFKISQDGSNLISGSENNNILIWNIQTNKLMMTLKGFHTNPVRSLLALPNSCFASLSDNKLVITNTSGNTFRTASLVGLGKSNSWDLHISSDGSIFIMQTGGNFNILLLLSEVSRASVLSASGNVNFMSALYHLLYRLKFNTSLTQINDLDALFDQPDFVHPSGFFHRSLRKHSYKLAIEQRLKSQQHLDVQDHNNDTFLHLAAKHKLLKLFARLIRLGANNNILNGEMKKPIDILNNTQKDQVNNLLAMFGAYLDHETKTPAQVITARIFLGGGNLDQRAQELTLATLSAIPEISPLMDLAKIGCMANHRLAHRRPTAGNEDDLYKIVAYDSDEDKEISDGERLRINIDPALADLRCLIPSYGSATTGAVGMYIGNDQMRNTLSLAGARSATNIKGTFIHEMCHWIAEEVFQNSCAPYNKGDSITQENWKNVTTDLLTKKSSLPELFKIVFEAPAYQFSEPNVQALIHHRELIVRIPQFIVTYAGGSILAIDWLKTTTPEMWDLYKQFLAEVQKHILKLQPIARGGWDISFFQRSSVPFNFESTPTAATNTSTTTAATACSY